MQRARRAGSKLELGTPGGSLGCSGMKGAVSMQDGKTTGKEAEEKKGQGAGLEG